MMRAGRIAGGLGLAALLPLAPAAQAQFSDRPCSIPALVELTAPGEVAFEGARIPVEELMARLDERRKADHDATCVTLATGRQPDPGALDDLIKRLKASWYKVSVKAGPTKRQ
jgi:hypothetical protein